MADSLCYGYRGLTLEINLSAREIQKKELDPKAVKRFIGGSAYNAWTLLQSTEPDTDPLSAENPLIFGAGPLVGLPFPTTGRATFTAISPLTNTFGDSNIGGKFGVSVKRSGFDHILIKGVADSPCYLTLGPDQHCIIEDARDLWGKTAEDTQTILKQKYKRAEVVTIGPAGENMVRYASIISFEDNAQASRSGMGAVMGSKKLKAIVVIGDGDIAVKDIAALKNHSASIQKSVKGFPFAQAFKKYGTTMFINMLEARGLAYAENWRRKIGIQDILSIDTHAYHDRVLAKKHGCFRCPLACGKRWTIKDGTYRDTAGIGLEVAHLKSFGLTLGVRDITHMLYLIQQTNRMGLDLNELSGTIGMLIDAQKNGIISVADCDGIELDWGSTEAIEKLIRKIGSRQGIGDILADGTRLAAKRIGNGAEKYALHMKGMHWPAHSAPPFVMAFSVSTRGGDFLKGVPHLLLQPPNAEVVEKLFDGTVDTMDIQSHYDKGRAVWWHENYKMITDCLGICFYLTLTLLPNGDMFPEELGKIYGAATGMELSGRDMLTAGERGYQVERAINSLRGLGRKDDTFTRRPEPDSWAQGIDLNKKGMLDEYYAYRGISESGLPLQERLEEIGLEDVMEKLRNRGKLGELAPESKYTPLSEIIKNPTKADIGKKADTQILNEMRNKAMTKMLESPLAMRKQFDSMRI